MDWLLGVLPHVLLVVFVVAGVIGSAVPAFPGAVVIMAGALLHGLLTGWDPLGLGWQLSLAVLTLISWGVQYVITAYGAKKYGASFWGVLGAAIGMFAGLAIPIPVLGPLIGAFLGALLFEFVVRWARAKDLLGYDEDAKLVAQTAGEELPEEDPERKFGKEETKQAAKAGLGAALGAVLGLMAELGVALLMAGVIALAFLIPFFQELFS